MSCYILYFIPYYVIIRFYFRYRTSGSSLNIVVYVFVMCRTKTTDEIKSRLNIGCNVIHKFSYIQTYNYKNIESGLVKYTCIYLPLSSDFHIWRIRHKNLHTPFKMLHCIKASSTRWPHYWKKVSLIPKKWYSKIYLG